MRAETKYIIRPNGQNVVVANLSYVKDPVEEIHNKCSRKTINILYDILHKSHEYDFEYNKTFKGVAVCQPEDTFDELIGKQIASIKCDKKYHNAMSRKYVNLIYQLSAVITEINALLDMHEDAIENLDKRYEDVIARIQPSNTTEDVNNEAKTDTEVNESVESAESTKETEEA